jgi:hypothetical protein
MSQRTQRQGLRGWVETNMSLLACTAIIAEIDLAAETISITIICLCRDWGEIVARASFVKPQISSQI